MTDAVEEFKKRVTKMWLPAFCHDAKRRYAIEGFRDSSILVSEVDARDCMYAMDHGLVVDDGGGRYRAARNTAFEQLFWTGPRDSVPRRITLWLEPVITFAALTRLNRDHDWPSELLGTQPRTWAYDLAAHKPADINLVHILCEVKKTSREADRVLNDFLSLSRGAATSTVSKNSRRKWDGLLIEKPSVLWVVGPCGYSKVMTVQYPAHDRPVICEAGPNTLDHAAA